MRAYAQGGHRTGQAGCSGCQGRRQPGRAAAEATEGLDVMDSNGVANLKRVFNTNWAAEGLDVELSNDLRTIVDMAGFDDVLEPNGCE